MNKLIIKAGLDSGMLNYVDHETPRHYFLASWATEEDLEKFAELIIRECIAQLEIGKKCDPYTGELFICERNDNIDYEIAVLKEHFGVE